MDSSKKILYIIIFVLLFISVYLIVDYRSKINTRIEVAENVKKYRSHNKDYYIITGDYKGEYDFKEFTYRHSMDNDYDFDRFAILNYDEYVKYCHNNNITVKYQDKNSNYLVYSERFIFQTDVKVRIANLVLKGDKATLYAMDGSRWYDTTIGPDDSVSIYIFPIPNNITEKELISLAPDDMTLDEIWMRDLVRNSTGVN